MSEIYMIDRIWQILPYLHIFKKYVIYLINLNLITKFGNIVIEFKKVGPSRS